MLIFEGTVLLVNARRRLAQLNNGSVDMGWKKRLPQNKYT